MADINTGFEIEVSAVVDEASAKEAGKKLNTYVLNSLKDGYIKIPAAVEAEFNKDGKASKELREAHREFIKQWKKMSSVGFDSSNEELDDFIKKYDKFTKLMSKEGQYNTKQNNALKKSGLGSLLRTYTNQVNAIEKQMAQLKKIDTTSHRQTKSNYKSKLSKEELDRYMKSKESYHPIPGKARTNVKAPEHVTETTLKETKYQGSYRSGFSRMNAVSMKEERPNELKSLKTKIVGVKKANEYAEKVLNEGKLYDSDVIRSRNKTSFSETEKSSKVSKVALKEAARLQGDIERGKKGEEGVEEHRALVQGSFALNQMSGKPVLDTTLDAVNSVIERYFKDVGNIELGGDEYAKGEGPGHELAKQVVKNTLDIVKKELTGVAGEDAEFQRQMRELAKIDPEAAIKQVSGLVTLSEDQNTILKQVLGQLKLNGNTTPIKESIDVNSVKTVAEKILTQNKVEAVSERVADDKEVKASRTLIDAAKSDASTGFNTDSKADLLISKQEKNSKILGKDVQGTLNDILSKIGTKQDMENTSASSETTEASLLQVISDNVQALRDGLVGKRVENSEAKSNPIGFDTSSIEGFEKSLREIMNVDRSLPAIVEKSLARIQAPGPITIPNPQKGLIPIKNTERTLDKGVSAGANLWEYAETKERNRQDERDRNRASTKANEEMLYEAAAKSNEFKYGVRTPKVIELNGLTETVEKTFPDKLKSILGGFGDKLEKIFGDKRPSSANAAQILQMSEEERAKEAAARLEKYGKTRGRDLSDTGAKSQYRYSQSLWSGDARVGRNSNLFQDIELTEGIGKVDTNNILSELQSAIEKNMFSAQTGGGFFKNLIGPAFGYLGMPSLEKSRAEVDGLNQVMADVREQVISILNEISGKEATLKAMEDQGQAVFNSEGKMVRGSAEAQNLFTDLENQKDTLRSALMEVQNIDAVVADCKGNVHEILQRLGFVMPELRKQNLIIQNINAGLDKNGKALKFQTRTAEILNYSFQLMARSIGQMWKNWMAMLNPINLIKKAFSDFMSYDVKWQRTMNVVKYNLRAIIKPFMEWLAQKIVNILGIIDIISMKIQQAFGKKPKSLFDQTAAAAEKTREEMEQAVSVSAGFDELHDISGDSGSGGTAENDLLGDIYKPELSEEWKKFAENLANVFIAIGKAIGWCLENWKLLLGLWAGFKIAQGLLNLLTWAHSLKAAFEALNLVSLAKLFGWLSVVLGAVLLLKSAIDRWEWNENFFGVNPDERRENGDKITKQTEIAGSLIGGGLGAMFGVSGLAIAGAQGLVIGALLGDGIAEGISGALEMALNLNKGDSEGVLHSAEKMGEGIGKTAGTALGAKLGMKAGAIIGAKLGTALAPGVGTAIGVFVGSIVGAVGGWLAGGKLGKALGNVVGHIANGLQSITRGSGAFQKLKVDATDVEKAMQNVSDKTAIYNDELSKLEAIEKLTGINAKELYESVQQGSSAYSDLSSTQKSVYDQYANMIAAEQNLQTAKLQNLEVSAKWEEQLARESGNYSEYIATMQKGVEDGIISQDQMVNYFAQTYGKINADAKLLFIDQLPEYLRESVAQQGVQYETFGNKVATTCANIKTSIQEGITNTVEKMKTGFSNAVETVKTSLSNFATNAATTWENVKTTAGQKWDELKTVAGQKWEDIKSTISQKWEDVKTDTKATWEAIKDAASNKWEDIKESAIGEKVKSIWENTTDKFKNLKDTLGQKWNEIKNAASLGWQNICNAIKGWVDSLWTAVTNVFDKIKTAAQNTWERVKNFFSGKGFKTNSQVDSSGNTKVTIAAYATGTNYVPSDGLAYLHKGEAVIPAKYNESFGVQGKAYQAQSAINTQLLNSIDRLERTMKQGISVNGQFVQRGSDLVAVVNKTKSQTGADLLSNVSYAR